MTEASCSLARMPRRVAAQRAAAAGTAWCLCSLKPPLQAYPDPASTVEVVTWTPFCNCWGIPVSVGNELVQTAMTKFYRANPSIRVVFTPPGGDNWLPQALLSGTAPDVFVNSNTTASMSLYFDTNALADLAPYVKADNVDLSVFPTPALNVVQQGGKLLGLPSYVGVAAMVVNLGLLDQLGLQYPEPGWTYNDWSRLWRAVAKPGKVYATNMYISGFSGPWFPSNFIYHGWGSYLIDPATQARTALGGDTDIAAGEWWFPWVVEGLATVGIWQNLAPGNIASAMTWMGGGVLQSVIVPALRAGIKFDFFEMPVWPKGRATIMDGNYWMMNAAAKHPQAAWELLRFIATDPSWPRAMIHATMLPPALKSVTADYPDMVRAVVPPLRSKNLDPLVRPLLGDYAYPNRVFRYSNTQAYTLYGEAAQQIVSKRLSVRVAYTQAAKQIDALEAQGPVLAGERARLELQVRRELAEARANAATVFTPAPLAVSWAGTAPTVSPGLLTRGPSGTYTLSGSGTGAYATVDGGAFAGSRWDRPTGTFVCRLLAMSLAQAGPLAYAAGAGLMVRDSLASGAAMTAVLVLPPQGIMADTRAFDTFNAGWQWGAPGTPGAAPVSDWQTARPSGANWLARPLWLRLVRELDAWTAWSSFDGKTWTQVGSPQALVAAGVWVGLFVTSNNPAQTLRATFDHLQGFSPEDVVAIG
jgi:ABC-type glycerol-3-phosphate transport system substrate-binding protein